jgi:hypothetical protein
MGGSISAGGFHMSPRCTFSMIVTRLSVIEPARRPAQFVHLGEGAFAIANGALEPPGDSICKLDQALARSALGLTEMRSLRDA